MTSLDITLVQTSLAWEAPADNRRHFDEILQDAGTTDLVVLPEMFSTGFSMASSRLAEPANGETAQWLLAHAARLDAVVCGSVITEDGRRYLNRLLWAQPDGNIRHYDKRHLFRMSTENENYSAGQDRLVFTLRDFRILPQICYDLRFPVFARNRNDYDLMLNVANWPAARRHHWQSLLTARAIENQVYVVGLNRVGTDGNQVAYAGDSAVIDFSGDRLLDLGDRDATESLTLDLCELTRYRDDFPAWRDADDFSMTDDR